MPKPAQLPKAFSQITQAWLVNRSQNWLILSRAGKVIASFGTRQKAKQWWESAIQGIDPNLRPELLFEDRLTKKELLKVKRFNAASSPKPSKMKMKKKKRSKQTSRIEVSKPNTAKSRTPKPHIHFGVGSSFRGREFINNDPSMPFSDSAGMAEWDAR